MGAESCSGWPHQGDVLARVSALEKGRRRRSRTILAESSRRRKRAINGTPRCLFDERGDEETAETWFRRAAELDQTYSMNWLAKQSYEADRLEEAKDWFRRASDAGNHYGTYNLGHMVDKEGDLRRAEELYRAAAEGGLRDAMDSLGYLLQSEVHWMRPWTGTCELPRSEALTPRRPFLHCESKSRPTACWNPSPSTRLAGTDSRIPRGGGNGDRPTVASSLNAISIYLPIMTPGTYELRRWRSWDS